MLTLNGITNRIPDVSVSLQSGRNQDSNKLTICHGLCETDKYVYLSDVQHALAAGMVARPDVL